MSAHPHPAIEVESVHKSFGAVEAVAGASLRLERGQVAALVGPSGSGKTTLLRLIVGFEQPDRGVVRIGGRQVAGDGAWVEPEERRIGMVFQHGALFPHLTLEANVRFGAASRDRARECLALVGLAGRAGAYPHELSGGERQRIAVARALAADPEVVVLDEPFAALDSGLREQLRGEVVAILRRSGASALLVTHDQAEALSVADAITVLRAGRIVQAGTPEEVYERPQTRWVAEFLGDAELLPGDAGDGVVQCELGRFPVSAELRGRVDVVVRPESIAISHRSGRDGTVARVVGREFFGHDQLVQLELESGLRLRSRRLGFPAWHEGDRVAVRIDGPVSAVAPERP